MTRMVGLSLLALGLVLARSGPAAAGTCYIDDAGENTPLVSPIQEGPIPAEIQTLCGHNVHGTNCVLQVGDDNSVDSSNSGADCLTLGSGVTVYMASHKITCTGSSCGTAIKITASGGSGSKVDFTGFEAANVLGTSLVSGCFLAGASGAGTNSHIENVIFDLAPQNGGSCSFSDFGTIGHGIYGIYSAFGGSSRFKDSSHIVVRNAEYGVHWGTSELDDSLIHDCTNGIAGFYGGTNVNLFNIAYNFVDSGGTCTECNYRNASVCNFFTTLYGLGCTTAVMPSFSGVTLQDDAINGGY